MKTDAVCISAKCGKSGKDFYMIYYKAFDNKWVLAYGKKDIPFSLDLKGGGAVAVDLTHARKGPQYKCPHCGEEHTFTCWNCGKRTCYDGDNHEGREVTCAHCGEIGVFRRTGGDGGGKAKETMGFGVSGQA